MNRIKSFFIGILLLAIMSAMIVLVTLIYRSTDQLSVKSYMFQTGNYADRRVGALQKLEDMSAIELRNKLIKKYISEYFVVVPGENDVANRARLEDLSSASAYEQWQNGEAVNIQTMSDNKMFRRVYVDDVDIAPMNMPDGYDYYNAVVVQPIWYSVRYRTETWPESNAMWIEPLYEIKNIYIEVKFKPGIRETVGGKQLDVKQYLESGQDPVGLFMFRVTNVTDRELE